MTLLDSPSQSLSSASLPAGKNVLFPDAWKKPHSIGWFSLTLCGSAIAIAISGIAGYVVGSSPIASLGVTGKPIALVTAIAIALLASGAIALGGVTPKSRLMARGIAIVVCLVVAEEVLSAALAGNMTEWQYWASRGGVHIHPFAATMPLLFVSALVLYFFATTRDLAGHIVATVLLLVTVLILFAYVLKVPSFFDPAMRIVPVPATALPLAMIALAMLIARPRGWIVPLCSRTSAGVISRTLLPATLVMPFVALALRNAIAGAPWFTAEVGLTVVVFVNASFGSAIVVGAALVLNEREKVRDRLAAIVNSSADAIIGKSEEGLIESWNAGAERLYGYAPDEIIGLSIAVLAPPELRDEVPHLFERMKRGERVEPFETIRICKDGRRINIRLIVSPIFDDAGELTGISTIGHDITEQKKTENALRESESRFRQVAESLPQLIWTCQPDGPCDYLNKRWIDFTGIPEGEQLGFGWIEQLHPDDRAPTVAAWEAAVAAGTDFRVEFRIRRHDGEYRWFDTRGTRLRDADGRTIKWFGSNTDISERKLAEQTIKNSADLLRRTQEVSRVGGWEYEIPAARLTWTEEVYRLHEVPLDFDPSDVAKAINFYADEDRETITTAFQAAVERGEPFDLELKLVTARKRTIWVRSLGRANIEDGRVVRVYGFIMDITDRKLAELRMLTTLADLERSNKELEQFAYVASHDLQEPLRMVSSYTQLLAQRYQDKLDADANDFIGFAVDGAKRMQRLITDLLAYSRVGSRGRPFENFDSHAALGRAVANLRGAIEESGALVTNDELPTLIGDESQITQLFQNLIGNGIKFRKDGVAPRIHVSAAGDGNEWRFSITDNGIGIAKEFHSRIFEIFQRLHTREQYPGTGIGLAICKKIVERHNGRIWLESEPDRASTFSFTLPTPATTEVTDVQ